MPVSRRHANLFLTIVHLLFTLDENTTMPIWGYAASNYTLLCCACHSHILDILIRKYFNAKPFQTDAHRGETLVCYVISPEHMIMEYAECGLVHMWVCACLCVQPCMHTRVCHARLRAWLLLSMHLLLWERSSIPVGVEHVRVCASSDHIAPTPSLSYILPAFLPTCAFSQ